MSISSIGPLGRGPAIVARPLSQQDVHVLIEAIQGTSTAPQLEALSRRLRAYATTGSTDLVYRARLEKLMLALQIRRGELENSAA